MNLETSPENIWLEPACACESYEGRTWCSEDQWGECEECDLPAVKYIRADLVTAAKEEAEQQVTKWKGFYDSTCVAATAFHDKLTAAERQVEELREWIKTVHDTFKRDLDQGFASRDKNYAIDLLGRALAATAPKEKGDA